MILAVESQASSDRFFDDGIVDDAGAVMSVRFDQIQAAVVDIPSTKLRNQLATAVELDANRRGLLMAQAPFIAAGGEVAEDYGILRQRDGRVSGISVVNSMSVDGLRKK